jgi:cytochrome c-type biogenesis protein CcmH
MPALSNDTIASVQGMSEGDRGAMIRGMVDRLASRLKQNGDDVEGWLRLARAYMVLKEPDNARAARDDARRALAANEAGLRKLNEGLKALGIDG